MRDLRQYARQTHTRLIVGGVLITFLVGLGLIYAIYGTGGMLTGLVCMLAGLSPVVLIWLALWLMDAAVKKANEDDGD
jgi:uncharacterized membrane protein YuzA (DUF378 family)